MHHNDWSTIAYTTHDTRPAPKPVPDACSFGSKCNLVEYQNNSYVNIHKSMICMYFHPTESFGNFLERTRRN